MSLRLQGCDDHGVTLEGYRELELRTNRGPVGLHYYPSPSSHKAVVWVGDAARGLYGELARRFMAERIASLAVGFRRPESQEESVLDVLASLVFLTSQGAERLALVGHGSGAMVALQAAAGRRDVAAVVALGPRGRVAEALGQLDPACAVLLAQESGGKGFGQPKRPRVQVVSADAETLGAEVERWLRAHLLLPEPPASTLQ